MIRNETGLGGQRIFIAHHAPLGCPWERKGEAYEFIAEPEPVAMTEEMSSPLTTVDDLWDEKTPVTEWWNEETKDWTNDDF